MFELASFLRLVAFSVIFAGIEYRYVNRSEAGWTKSVEGFNEKPVFWVISPYHAYLLLPLFVAVSFALPPTAWAANTFAVAVIEDIAYFAWAKRRVVKGEWTTQLFGSFRLGGLEIPVWWPLDTLIIVALYLAPF